jgi:hypothetical protein
VTNKTIFLLLSSAILGLMWTSFAYSQTDLDTTKSESVESKKSEVYVNSLANASSRFTIGEELILTLIVGNLNYGEIFAVVSEDGLMVNLEEFIDLLDFPINKVQAAEGYELSGWYIKEDNLFSLQLFNQENTNGIGTVTYSEQKYIIQASQYSEFAGDYYFDFDMAASWFGISLSVDLSKLVLSAAPSSPLPAQLKSLREKNRAASLTISEPQYSHYDMGYYGRSHQLFDANINTFYRDDNLSARYSVNGVQDILGLSSRFYVSGTDNDLLNSAELSFLKQSKDADLLSFLKARTVEYGDIRPVRVGNTTSAQSLGITINNNRLGVRFDTEVTSISGILQDDWDVELYQNGVLIQQLSASGNGRYDFLDVALFGGLNSFEIVKYGPQGQVEREKVERNIDGTLFSPIPTYNMSLTQNNASVFGLNESNEIDQDINFSGSYGYAVTDWFAGRFGHSININSDTLVDDYVLGGTARLTPRLLANVNLRYRSDSSSTMGVSLQSNFADQYINFSFSRSNSSLDTSANLFSLSMNGVLVNGSLGQLSYTNLLRHYSSDSDNYTQSLSNTLTFGTRAFNLSHNFLYRGGKAQGIDILEEKSGSISLGTFRGIFSGRVNAAYSIGDELEWDNVSANLTYKFANKYSARLGYQQSLLNDSSAYTFGLDWRQPSYVINTRLTHSADAGTSVSLNARFSMSEAPPGLEYITSNRSLTTTGTVIVRVFEDVNRNFIFDAEDRPLEGVKVLADQVNKRAVSDEKGHALLTGLLSFKQTDLSIIKDSIDDPYLLQSTVNTSLTPRSGLLAMVNYPFIQGAEFEGSLSAIDAKGEKQVLSNADINIYSSNGVLVKTVRSEFDGYFYSGVVFPDKYLLKVSDDYVKRKYLKSIEQVLVNASDPGDLVTDIEINLKKLVVFNGFQAYAGAFSNKSVARAYFKILYKRSSSKTLKQNLHHHHSEADDKHYVGYQVFSNPDQATQFCMQLQTLMMKCKVRRDAFIADNG